MPGMHMASVSSSIVWFSSTSRWDIYVPSTSTPPANSTLHWNLHWAIKPRPPGWVLMEAKNYKILHLPWCIFVKKILFWFYFYWSMHTQQFSELTVLCIQGSLPPGGPRGPSKVLSQHMQASTLTALPALALRVFYSLIYNYFGFRFQKVIFDIILTIKIASAGLER